MPGLTFRGIAANTCHEISDSSGGIKLQIIVQDNVTVTLNQFALSSDCSGTPAKICANYTLGTCNGFINDGVCRFFSSPYVLSAGAPITTCSWTVLLFAALMLISVAM
jgi:hypothetical protein